MSKTKKRERENENVDGGIFGSKRVKVDSEDAIRRSSCVFPLARKPLMQKSPNFGNHLN
jgi:hypothetical protein